MKYTCNRREKRGIVIKSKSDSSQTMKLYTERVAFTWSSEASIFPRSVPQNFAIVQQALSLAVRGAYENRRRCILFALCFCWKLLSPPGAKVVSWMSRWLNTSPCLMRAIRGERHELHASPPRSSSLDLGIISTERVYVYPIFAFSVQHRRMHAPLNNLSVGNITAKYPSQRASVLRATLRPLCTFVWRSTLSAPRGERASRFLERNWIKTFQLYGKITERL